MVSVTEIMRRARRLGLAVPAFNVPYLAMIEPVVRAVVDQDAFALVEVARLEWVKFESGSPARVAAELERWCSPQHVRLHLDHVPVLDEDGQRVDYLAILREALGLGYESVMVDGSRLALEENIRATAAAAALAHSAGVPLEAELGAVLGHEDGPLPDYEELFASGRGFTDVSEARRFVVETGCDWLSVAVGNIHGAIAVGRKDRKKVQARIHLERLEQIAQAAGVPLVLHGGSGIPRELIVESARRGIAKINIGTEIRQPYEAALAQSGSLDQARQAVYDRVAWVLRDFLGLSGKRAQLSG